MEKNNYLIIAAIINLLFAVSLYADEPDKAYLFAYGTQKNAGKNGLHFAWSPDKKEWHPIGPESAFLKSDYGAWGKEKRMLSPFLYKAPDGVWHCIWGLNEYDGVFAHASSTDLVYWGRQSYPRVNKEGNCLNPEMQYDADTGQTLLYWTSNSNAGMKTYCTRTKDFKHYAVSKEIVPVQPMKQEALISGRKESGTLHEVPWSVINTLMQAEKLNRYKAQQNAERLSISPELFKEPVHAKIIVSPKKSKPISNLLIGVFFEDINYAADGGLYAELIQNRDFEYSPADRGREPDWDSRKAWSVQGGDVSFTIDTVAPVHPNNRHYAVLQIARQGRGLTNGGFGGIPVKEGEKYDFTVFARTPEAKAGKLTIRILGKEGELIGEASTKKLTKAWKNYNAVITVNKTVNDARVEVVPQMTGRVDLDMVSLFPQKTFKNRKNGLRPDLAQTIADLHPRFIRFPGGCVAHGDGIENIYRWENTIGPLESRKPLPNLWGYHQTMGLGYFEYFQYCEDIGAEPLPVVAAGVPCQNSSTGGAGQQGGIPMCEMPAYVQSILNLIEWANGDPKKNEWAKKRAEAGHQAPFNLKYLGVGNEDLITDVFEERFTMIFNAVKEKYPEITVIGTVGPYSEGTDYVEGWKLATRLGVPMVDEHYYQPAGWLLNNQDYYDRYDRSKPKVYLGEYATHIPGKVSNIETALLEAFHLAGCERNGDVVSMTSYAPLLAKNGHTRWNPDLIYFTNTEVKPTVSYYTQLLYGQNAGDWYIPSRLELSDNREETGKRMAVSVVKDSRTGDVIVKLVNLLPVSVKSELDLSGMGIEKRPALKSVLNGEPEDRKAKPRTSAIIVDKQLTEELAPYSFTVIRIRAKQ